MHVVCLSRGKPGLWYRGLDDKVSIGGEMTRGVLETADLIVGSEEIPPGMKGLDIGPSSVELFKGEIAGARTIFWNGPMGVFEIDAYARGTLAMAHAIADAYALTIIGGGETALAVHRAGVSESMSFISTGGGAALELLEGKKLPGLVALPDRTN